MWSSIAWLENWSGSGITVEGLGVSGGVTDKNASGNSTVCSVATTWVKGFDLGNNGCNWSNGGDWSIGNAWGWSVDNWLVTFLVCTSLVVWIIILVNSFVYLSIHWLISL